MTVAAAAILNAVDRKIHRLGDPRNDASARSILYTVMPAYRALDGRKWDVFLESGSTLSTYRLDDRI